MRYTLSDKRWQAPTETVEAACHPQARHEAMLAYALRHSIPLRDVVADADRDDREAQQALSEQEQARQ